MRCCCPFSCPTVVSVAIVVGILAGLKAMPWEAWYACVLVPAVLYALFADKTKRTVILDKVVLVTGASSGLGKNLAIEASKRQAKKVILVARSEGKLHETAAECKKVNSQPGFEAVVMTCDLNDVQDIKRLAGRVTAEHGAVDLLINNAGAGAWKHMEDHTPEDVVAMLACPLQAGMVLTALLVPEMAKAGTGHIMNITSISGFAAFRGAVGYSAARWGVRGFTKNLYWDMKELGIGVTLLSPAEIEGTDYFKTAGGDSKNRIPALFQLLGKFGLNYSPAATAWAGLNAVENGWSIANTPAHVAHLSVVCNGLLPFFIECVANCGSAGVRGKKQSREAPQQELAAPLATQS